VFDSTLLAYAPKRRQRLLPDVYRDVVYVKVNGQLKPTFLVDGMAAGTWSIATARSTATLTLTLTPLQRLGAATRKALLAEAEGMVRALPTDAKTYEVRLTELD
jgi:Winged helix DNA-binding domain